jgi:hypothetical protein
MFFPARNTFVSWFIYVSLKQEGFAIFIAHLASEIWMESVLDQNWGSLPVL